MRKGIVFVFGLALMAGLAWWAGTTFAERLSSGKVREASRQREKLTKSFVGANFILGSGNRWPDATLQSLDGEWLSFSEVISDNTLLIFIQPGCAACEEELDALGELLSDGQTSSRIILVSNAYPLELATLRRKRSIQSTILIDRAGDLYGQFSSLVFPLNVLLGRGLKILSVNAGQLSRHEIDSLLD